MIIPGFCQTCRKVKNVRVGNAGMMALARGGTAVGQCGSCADAEERERAARYAARTKRRETRHAR